MKLAAFFAMSLIALGGTCFGAEADPSVLAVGAWSEPVKAANYMKLRGRLKICEYPDNRGLAPGMDVALYVELQEFSDSVGGIEKVYFDPQALKCELTDSAGKAVPRSGGEFSGAVPGPVWIDLPSFCSMLVRVTPYHGGGRMPDGGFGLWGNIGDTWTLKADDAATYYLSGKLTVNPPADHKSDNPQWVWSGSLTLPKMAVSMKQLRPKK